MKHLLLKNTGDPYYQKEYINLSDQVNSLSKFISIAPEELLEKVVSEIPKGVEYITDGLYDVFEIPGTSPDIDVIKAAFCKNFNRLVHENNSRLPIRYKIMNIFSKPDENGKRYGDREADREIDRLSKLRLWRIDSQRFFTNS